MHERVLRRDPVGDGLENSRSQVVPPLVREGSSQRQPALVALGLAEERALVLATGGGAVPPCFVDRAEPEVNRRGIEPTLNRPR
ncbi:MAG: hypothetical protein WKH64_02610 [Chloroflexia bacterium]